MFYSPMLPARREGPFDDDRYAFEPLVDGIRLQLWLENGKVRLRSRHGFDVTAGYPEFWQVPVADGADTVLDGVAAAFDPMSGASRSDWLRERYLLRKPMEIRAAAISKPARYFAFDLLRFRGQDLRERPLVFRRRLLHRILEGNGAIDRMPVVDRFGTYLFDALGEQAAMGVVAKRKNSLYAAGTNRDWLRIDRYRYANVTIAGYRKNGFAWLVRYPDGAEGVVERDIPLPYRRAFQGVAKAIVAGEDRHFVYVKPVLTARIRYRKLSGGELPQEVEFVDFAG
jgi:DNA ligase-1